MIDWSQVQTQQDAEQATREQVEALRLTAYAHPVTGSDRYFAEANRMWSMNESGHEAVQAQGAARYAEIQAEYPWP